VQQYSCATRLVSTSIPIDIKNVWRVGLLRRCGRIESKVLIEMETRREKLEPRPFAHRITPDKMLRLHWEGRSDDLRLSNRCRTQNGACSTGCDRPTGHQAAKLRVAIVPRHLL